MQEMLLNYPNLRVVEASVEDIILDKEEKVQGIKTQDGAFFFSFILISLVDFDFGLFFHLQY